jgi:pimeloyl-ACP methyl ester carboxylesterase
LRINSSDEHALFDLPAMIDMVTEVTGHKEIFYIGHSMGTMVFWQMSNVQPHYRDKIKAMFAMAPVARVDHMRSPIALLAPFVSEIKVKKIVFILSSFHMHISRVLTKQSLHVWLSEYRS